MLLLTDGLANVGINEPERLVEIARGAGREGVGTTTIGFGHDFDEDLLTQMADAGGGNAHYAETPDAAPRIFAEELEGLTKLAAQNVTLEIRPRADVEMVGVLNDYPQVAVEGGVRVELGDAYAGEWRRIVIGLHIPRLAELGVVNVCDLVLRYVSVGDEIAERTLTIPVVANAVSAEEARRAEADAEVHEEVLVLKGARARQRAIELADGGDFVGADRELSFSAEELRAAGFEEQVDALEGARPSVAPASYGPAGRKQLRYSAHGTQRRRR